MHSTTIQGVQFSLQHYYQQVDNTIKTMETSTTSDQKSLNADKYDKN